MRLGCSQHGEKSLKFHLINRIEEYAKKKKKKKKFKQKYVNPLSSVHPEMQPCLSMLQSAPDASQKIGLVNPTIFKSILVS